MDETERQIADLIARLAMAEQTVDRAIKVALQKTMRSLARSVAASTALELGIAVKLLTQRMKQTSGRFEEKLSIIAYDLPLILAGAVQTTAGVRADGGRSVPGAFIARGRYGKLPRRVFRRLGSARGPIAEQKIAVLSSLTANVSAYLEKQARTFFLRCLEQEIRQRGGLIAYV